MQNLLTPLQAEPIPVLLVAFVLAAMALVSAGLAIDIVLVILSRLRPIDWSGRALRLRRRPWTWRDGGLLAMVMATAYTVTVLATNAVVWLGLAPGNGRHAIPVVLQTAIFHGTALVFVLFLLQSRRISWHRAFGNSNTRLLKAPLQGACFYLAALPVIVVTGLLYSLLLVSAGYPVEPQGVVRLLIHPGQPPWLLAYLGVLAVTVAPLAEELVFRGIMLPLLSRHIRMPIAVFAVSALFAAMHFHIPSVVPLFVFAVSLSLAYLYTGSMLVPICMHAIFNGVSLAGVIMLKDLPVFGS